MEYWRNIYIINRLLDIMQIEEYNDEYRENTKNKKKYTLIGSDGHPYMSEIPGKLGGHRKNRIYGRLDCPVALRWIEKGHYVKHRVFFEDEKTAIAAGYRPCAVCLPEKYAQWKDSKNNDA